MTKSIRAWHSAGNGRSILALLRGGHQVRKKGLISVPATVKCEFGNQVGVSKQQGPCLQGPKRPHKHKDPTNHEFWYPIVSGLGTRM